MRSDKVNNVISSRRQWQSALWVGAHRIKPSRSECSALIILLILLLSSLVVLWSVFFAHSRAEDPVLTTLSSTLYHGRREIITVVSNRWINDSAYGEERGNGTKEILAQGRRFPIVNVLPGVNEVLKGRRELQYICPQFRLPQHPGSCTEETTLGELVRIPVATCHFPLPPHAPICP